MMEVDDIKKVKVLPPDYKILADQLIGFLAGKGLLKEAEENLIALQNYMSPVWLVEESK